MNGRRERTEASQKKAKKSGFMKLNGEVETSAIAGCWRPIYDPESVLGSANYPAGLPRLVIGPGRLIAYTIRICIQSIRGM